MKSIRSLPLQTSTESGPGTRAAEQALLGTQLSRACFTPRGLVQAPCQVELTNGISKDKHSQELLGFTLLEMPWHFSVCSQLSVLSYGGHWFGPADVTPSKTWWRVKASLYHFGAWWRIGHLSMHRWDPVGGIPVWADLCRFTAFREK